MRPRMTNYPKEIPEFHPPIPPQLQFLGLPHCRVGSPNAHDGAAFNLFGPFQDPQLYETDEQSQGADSYGNRNYDSQTSTNYSAREPPRTPRIDENQGHGPWQAPNHVVGLAREIDVVQTGEHPVSFESAFEQQGNYTEAPSAVNPSDARHHVVSRRSSTTLSPVVGLDRVGHARRNSQHEPPGTGRHYSVGSRTRPQISNLENTQIPLGPGPSAIQVSQSDWQVNQSEAATTSDWFPPLFPLDWPSGMERHDPAETNRHLAIDPGLPQSAAGRADDSELGHIGQSSYQGIPEYPLASPIQRQSQGIQRGRTSSLSFAQDWSVMPYDTQPLDSHDLARNVHEPPPGYTDTYLSPGWQSSQMVSSNLKYGKRSNVSDNEERHPPRITNRRSNKKRRLDSSSPTTPPTTTKHVRRRYNSKERAEVHQKRKTGACTECRKAKRKVWEPLQTSLCRCHQAYCSCSARTRRLGIALP